jgi:xanthine/CO dehydrogenase XdhC/CoxF family maturation factor
MAIVRVAKSHDVNRAAVVSCYSWCMDRRETERIVSAVETARAAGRRVAFATIVRVIGSAYRREGTRMLVRENGTYECMLSGGCLEPAIVDAAQQVIATGTPRVVRYDLAEDVVWGLGLGCGGAVDIRIERLDEDDPVTGGWLEVLGRGTPAVLVTPLAGADGRLLVADGGVVVGRLGTQAIASRALARASERLRDPHQRSGVERIEDAELFFEMCAPAPELVVFGAGHDAVPMVRLASDVGFAVTVVDVREAFLTSSRFPGARLVSAAAGQFRTSVPLTAQSFALIMNHNLARDEESLRCAFDSDARYIGVLGPRSRYEKLLASITAEGYVPDPTRLAVVRSPVGLALGAETPEEVAVSVVGEIVALLYGFDGGFLSGLQGRIHSPSDNRLLARS